MDARSTEEALRALMIAGLAGDADAHRTVLTLVSGRLRAYFKSRLTRIGRDEVDAEDLVQDTLIAIHTRRHTYDPTQLFTPWVYAIARYKFLDHLRRTKASLQDVAIDDARDALMHEDLVSIDTSVDLQKLLDGLSPKARRAIQYVKLDGLSIKEAAARTGMSESAIKVSIHRGLKALTRLLHGERAR
jgi:RNA polymerase sigma-70 factor (ECF subfamily)